jgi:ubiquinone/menaquinone biosynthesis C-methylase UbiE
MYNVSMSASQSQPRGHRWFAAAYNLMMKAGEKRLRKTRQELLAGLQGDVLEIGAGTGLNFEHYPQGVRVVAIEPDPHMLKRAQRHLLELGRTDIDVRLASAEQLPVDDASFDTVVSTLVLCTVADVPRALTEIRRVLRPGGSLVFVEHVRGMGTLGRLQDVIRPVWSWMGAGCQVNRRTEDSLVGAGFQVGIQQHTKAAPWMPVIIGAAKPA